MKALGRPGVDVSRLNVEFYIQLLTAEVHAAAGRFSKVEECLPPRVLRRYWNVVVHHRQDAFSQQCTLRAVRCVLSAAAMDDPAMAPAVTSILGGLVFGASDVPVARAALLVLLTSCGSLEATVHALSGILQQHFRPRSRETAGGDLAAHLASSPQHVHLAARVFLAYEVLFQHVVLHEVGVERVLAAEPLGDGLCFARVFHAVWAAGGDGRVHAAAKAWALRAVAALGLASPVRCLTAVPILATAVFLEEPRAADLALGLLWDLAFLHPQLGATVPEDADDVVGGGGGGGDGGRRQEGLQFLLDFLGSDGATAMPRGGVRADQQRVACFGVCRLLLHGGVCPSPEYLLAKLARVAADVNTDPIARGHVSLFLESYARGDGAGPEARRQEHIADGVVQLCVELHSQLLAAATTPPHPAVALLMQHVKPHLAPAISEAVARNFVDFFGAAPEASVLATWVA